MWVGHRERRRSPISPPPQQYPKLTRMDGMAGMVSTIMDEPPQLNWIYVDEETNEVKYGNKIESAGGLMGPWNCTKVDRRMTFDGWEGFIAVQERPDVWALYFDVADDGLRGKVHKKRMVEVELTRKERRKTKENADDKDYQ